MALAAMPYARSGYNVVIDFSIPPWYLETIKKILFVRSIPVHYVVIRPSMDICASRAANRSEGAIPDYAMYKELYQCFDEAQRYIIFADSSDAATIASYIMEGLNSGDFLV